MRFLFFPTKIISASVKREEVIDRKATGRVVRLVSVPNIYFHKNKR